MNICSPGTKIKKNYISFKNKFWEPTKNNLPKDRFSKISGTSQLQEKVSGHGIIVN